MEMLVIKTVNDEMFVVPKDKIIQMAYIDNTETLIKIKRKYWLEYLENNSAADEDFETWCINKDYDFDSFSDEFIFEIEGRFYSTIGSADSRIYPISIEEDETFVFIYSNNFCEEFTNLNTLMDRDVYIDSRNNFNIVLQKHAVIMGGF